MARLFRAKLNWTGFVGAPGYSVFHGLAFEADPTAEATSFRNAVNNFGVAISSNLPNNVSVSVDPDIEVIEDSTGILETVVSTAPVAATLGTGGVAYSAPTGAVINWRTGQIRRGRRMRGRTFVVPLASAAYENNGTLVAAARADLQSAADAFIADAGTQLVVYGRPTPLAADGMNGVVTQASVPDMAAVLRSRRD